LHFQRYRAKVITGKLQRPEQRDTRDTFGVTGAAPVTSTATPAQVFAWARKDGERKIGEVL